MSYPPCPLSKQNEATRDNPRNAFAAHATQLHDTAVVLWQVAHAQDQPEVFRRQLQVLKAEIESAERLCQKPE